MTVLETLTAAAGYLTKHGIESPRLNAEHLLAYVLGKKRLDLYLEFDRPLSDAERAPLRDLIRERGSGKPLQHLLGTAEFFGRSFLCDARALIPRPETEVLVDLALMVSGGVGTIADICTGSGCIALALAAEGSYDRVIGTDLSADALDVARANLRAIPEERRALVEFRQGDLLAPLQGERVRTIVSNPPYISPAEAGDLPAAVRDWEPHLALFSEDEGMAAIRALVRGAPDVLQPGGVLLMEVDSTRARLVRDVVEGDPHYRGVEIRLDLTGRERFVVARRKES